MRFEAAFEAFRNGEFKAAVPLLEQAARETGYRSDAVNHAYTLALYHSGEKERLAEVAFRVGNSLVSEDPGSAMDYFQRALFAGLDGTKVRRIGQIFEQWSAPFTDTPTPQPIRRVAHVLGCVLPGHAPTQYVKLLAASLSAQGISSSVFTTEWAASWFFNPLGIPQTQQPVIPETTVASVDGDFLERAERIAAAIRSAGIQAAFYHASLSEQITARVAAMRPAPIQINVNHGSEMDPALFDGYIHIFQNALLRTRHGERPAEWIPLASDIEDRLSSARAMTREGLGLPSGCTVSATFGNLYKVAGSGYLGVLKAILQRFPSHFHLFAGAGDVKPIRTCLHAEGVLPRVRFLGHMADVAPLLHAIDVYLASFPHSGGHSLLEAMGAGRPVVVLRYPADSHYNSGAELVGIPELIASGEAEYTAAAARIIGDPRLRESLSGAVLQRFRSEFRPSILGVRYRTFLESVAAKRTE